MSKIRIKVLDHTYMVSKKTLIKAVSWRIMDILIMAIAFFIMSGSIVIGTALSLSLMIPKIILFYIHERSWKRIFRWWYTTHE